MTLPGIDPRAPWMRGANGERIYLLDPGRTEIRIDTIAQTLGRICRFGGHTSRFYSVAEHSLHVAILMQDRYGDEGARYGLFHDAHEAYVGDCPTPLKVVLGSKWRRFEADWEERVAEALGLPPAPPEIAAALHVADRIALATEMRRLMVIDDSREIEGVEPDEYWDCLGIEFAGEAFYQRAVQLGFA